MKLSSDFFENGGLIPVRFTCDGENISPSLKFTDVPDDVVSFALIVEDPDVPVSVREDGMWDHWVLWNIPKDIRELEVGVSGVGVSGMGTGGKIAYSGPCPPDREHRYFFRLFALDIELDLKEGSSKVDLLGKIGGHILEMAEIVGKYSRS